MLSSRKPLRIVLILLAVTIAFVAAPGVVSAEEHEVTIHPGIYTGQWHGDAVRFIFEEVAGDGTFSGIVHFDKSSNYPDALFLFTGHVDRHGDITIKRDASDPQMSRAREPRREDGRLIWHGETTGGNLDHPYPFELRVQVRE